MKKSLLFLTNAYPDTASSYRGIFIEKTVHLLMAQGYRISVITPKIYKNSHYFEKENKLKVYRFPFFARNKLLIEYQKIPYLRMILYCINGFFLTLYAVYKNKCDIIHVHWAIPTGIIGVGVGKLLKKPLVVTIHGSDLRIALEKRGLIQKIFLFVCKSANHLICVSSAQKKKLRKIGLEGNKISIIPMGIDASFLEAGEKRKTNKKQFIVLSNRNLLPIYNISLLIRSIPIVLNKEPKTKFIIAGDGSYRKILENKVRDLNIGSSLTFLGRVPHRKMPDILSKADIYVSTSLYDGTSVSLLEAMGSGVFPIVTDIPANRAWIINGKNGILVSKDDEKMLANKIIDTIRHYKNLKKYQIKNRLIVEKKALWQVHIEKIKNIYENCMKS